jgi:hypothetical protein
VIPKIDTFIHKLEVSSGVLAISWTDRAHCGMPNSEEYASNFGLYFQIISCLFDDVLDGEAEYMPIVGSLSARAASRRKLSPRVKPRIFE